MALGSAQHLTEMSTRNLPVGEGRPARKADNISAIFEQIVLENVGASQTYEPPGPVTRKVLSPLCNDSVSI
jgi:hypothetical protein